MLISEFVKQRKIEASDLYHKEVNNLLVKMDYDRVTEIASRNPYIIPHLSDRERKVVKNLYNHNQEHNNKMSCIKSDWDDLLRTLEFLDRKESKTTVVGVTH
jgi:hypothetical protein